MNFVFRKVPLKVTRSNWRSKCSFGKFYDTVINDCNFWALLLHLLPGVGIHYSVAFYIVHKRGKNFSCKFTFGPKLKLFTKVITGGFTKIGSFGGTLIGRVTYTAEWLAISQTPSRYIVVNWSVAVCLFKAAPCVRRRAHRLLFLLKFMIFYFCALYTLVFPPCLPVSDWLGFFTRPVFQLGWINGHAATTVRRMIPLLFGFVFTVIESVAAQQK